MSIRRWGYVDDNTEEGVWRGVMPLRHQSTPQEQWDLLQQWLQGHPVAHGEGQVPMKEKSLQAQLKERAMSVTMLKSLIQKLEQTSDLDEVVMGLAQAKALKLAYTETGIPVPEWIAEAVDTLAAEVKRRTQDELKRQEKALVQELEALKSREEKRSEKEQRLAALRERLKS